MKLSKVILDAAFRVHSALGPGLLEGAYEACLAYELRSSGLKVQTQIPMPLVYREVMLEVGYRLDILVEDVVIIELKAVDALAQNPSRPIALLPQAESKKAGPSYQFQRS